MADHIQEENGCILNSRQTIPLETSNLAIGYNGKIIYRNLDLSIASGELVCLLGQNGVGKSTLLKTLSGIIPCIEGEIKIGSKEMKSFSHQELARQISVVTTEKHSASGLSVLDVMLAGRYPYQKWLSSPTNSDFDIIAKAADQTQISYLLEKKLDELSDGQRQKVMISRALVQDSDLILLDEPTAHLDLTNRVEIMRLLSEISKKEGKTLLISTHELNLALQFADQLWLMDYGVPIVSGVPEDLVISGDLSRIYHHQHFDYDLITGKVRSINTGESNVHIEAPTELGFWINNAIDRIGFNPENDVRIKANLANNVVHWYLVTGDFSYKGVTIDELIKQLLK